MTRRARSVRLYMWVTAMLSLLPATNAFSAGDVTQGAKVFQACAVCHSIAPGVNMTGPSLARVWERKAGTTPGFSRYSDAMKHANVVWNEAALDRWLTNPGAFIPGTTMTFAGIRDSGLRQDVIAYLRAVSDGKVPRGNARSPKANLRHAPDAEQVTSVTHCKDTYVVKTADGKVNKIWEFNLRLKTDSSDMGPAPGKPVMVGNGMRGDRAAIVFSSPGEISRYIAEQCP